MTDTTKPTIPVGVMEIAARAGVTEITVRKWVERHADSTTRFPGAVGKVSGRDAYWWHEVVDWLATSGRLTKVEQLERIDEYGLTTEYLTIRYDQPGRNWILAVTNDDTAIHSWNGEIEDPGRPWMIRDEDELVAEVRGRLLDGWAIS